MTTLWLPEKEPPQVGDTAKKIIAERVENDGLAEVVAEGKSRLRQYHYPLFVYLEQLGLMLNKLSDEGPWPQQALKVGYGLAAVAYTETGFFQRVEEDVMTIGLFSAELTGVPQVYQSTVEFDGGLASLVVLSANKAKSDLDTHAGVQQVTAIGAGCVRHFMQQAIAA